MSKTLERLVTELEQRYASPVQAQHRTDISVVTAGGWPPEETAEPQKLGRVAGPALTLPETDVATTVTYFDAADLGTFGDGVEMMGVQVAVTAHPRGEADIPSTWVRLPDTEAEAWARVLLGRRWSQYAYYLRNSHGPWEHVTRVTVLLDRQAQPIPAPADFHFAGVPLHSGQVTVRALDPVTTHGPTTETIAPADPAASLQWPVELTGSGPGDAQHAAHALLDALKIKGRIDHNFQLLTMHIDGRVAAIGFRRRNTGAASRERVTLPTASDLAQHSDFCRRSIPRCRTRPRPFRNGSSNCACCSVNTSTPAASACSTTAYRRCRNTPTHRSSRNLLGLRCSRTRSKPEGPRVHYPGGTSPPRKRGNLTSTSCARRSVGRARRLERVRLGLVRCDRVVAGVDESAVFGVPVQLAQRVDDVAHDFAAAAIGTPDHPTGPDLFTQHLQVRGGGFVESPLTPAGLNQDLVPVRAVVLTGTARGHPVDRGGDELGEGRCETRGLGRRCGAEVGGGETEAFHHHMDRGDISLGTSSHSGAPSAKRRARMSSRTAAGYTTSSAWSESAASSTRSPIRGPPVNEGNNGASVSMVTIFTPARGETAGHSGDRKMGVQAAHEHGSWGTNAAKKCPEGESTQNPTLVHRAELHLPELDGKA
ncbi:hypothetical protein [Nocardia sp. NPDC019395]|uniref:hypothetical protein n=1 Tax=Nocardia sp. NPDC019395 TaxID=3154686 RepID=UPI0033C133AA